MMSVVMIRLKNAVYNTQQRMRQAALLEAEVKWDITRGQNNVDYLVWRFFPKDSEYRQVRPMDRLIACWSHLTLAKKEGPEVLHKNRKRDKKDVEVM